MREMREAQSLQRAPRTRLNEAGRGELVLGKVPQGYETKINVRLVPGQDIDITDVRVGCLPRKGAPRRDAEPLNLPRDLIDKLKDADKAVVAWLARDEANARLFMARPAEALEQAGVELTRADQKAIERTHRAVREAAVVAPGVKVVEMTVAAFPRGRIGRIKPQPRDDSDSGKGCAKED